MTDTAIENELKPKNVTFLWKTNETLTFHVNGMTFKAYRGTRELGEETYYSVGGGVVISDSDLEHVRGPFHYTFDQVYEYSTMKALMKWCNITGYKLSDFVYLREGADFRSFLTEVWETMKHCVENGLQSEGILPGGLNLQRKAHSMYLAAQQADIFFQVQLLLVSHSRGRRFFLPTRLPCPRTTPLAKWWSWHQAVVRLV